MKLRVKAPDSRGAMLRPRRGILGRPICQRHIGCRYCHFWLATGDCDYRQASSWTPWSFWTLSMRHQNKTSRVHAFDSARCSKCAHMPLLQSRRGHGFNQCRRKMAQENRAVYVAAQMGRMHTKSRPKVPLLLLLCTQIQAFRIVALWMEFLGCRCHSEKNGCVCWKWLEISSRRL